MSDPLDIKVDDFVVVNRGSWGRQRFIYVKATKVTARQFEASGEWSSRSRRYTREDAVYAGPESDAKLLCERLTSSLARCTEEQQNSTARCTQRNETLIREARQNRANPTEAQSTVTER